MAAHPFNKAAALCTESARLVRRASGRRGGANRRHRAKTSICLRSPAAWSARGGAPARSFKSHTEPLLRWASQLRFPSPGRGTPRLAASLHFGLANFRPHAFMIPDTPNQAARGQGSYESVSIIRPVWHYSSAHILGRFVHLASPARELKCR